MLFRILILFHACVAFPFKCPEPAQWSLRARSHCPDPSKYFCLKNDLINDYSENCTVFDFLQPGRKHVLRGGLDADICSSERYQPWPMTFYTNVSTNCIFLKSLCKEEGQVVNENGNRNTDTTCKCDYTKGYDFLVKPRNPCFCVPLEEDCSCYLKTCIDSTFKISPDYECIDSRINISMTNCLPMMNGRDKNYEIRSQKQHISRKDNMSSPVLWKILAWMSTFVVCIGFFFVFCGNALLEKYNRTAKYNIPLEIQKLNPSQKDRYIKILLKEPIEDVKSTDGIDIARKSKVHIETKEWIVCQEDTTVDVNERIGRALRQTDISDNCDHQEKNAQTRQKTANLQINANAYEQTDGGKVSIQRQITREIEDELKIPKNIRDQHKAFIDKWERNEEVFSATHSTEKIMQMVKEKSHTTIVGSPGSGKTSISRHVALKLKHKEDYHIVPVDSVEDILKYGDDKLKQVFVHDDILGKYGVDVNKENFLESKSEAIVNLLEESGSKLIMTCRKAVFNAVKLTKSLVTKYAFDVDKEENKWTREDKKAILRVHCNKNGVQPEIYDSISLESAFIMFPLLCKLFAIEKQYQKMGVQFFTEPYECLIGELRAHQQRSTRHNEYYYAALVMCMINGGKLSRDNFPEAVIQRDVYKYCNLDTGTSNGKLVEALEQLEGTYTVESGGEFSFIHDTIFEVIAYTHGTKFPNQIIKYLPTSYIANMVSVGGEHTALCIQLKESDYHLLAERIYRDIQSMELNYVFRNVVLKHHTFFEIFKQTLQNKPYNEIRALFFQEQDAEKCKNIINQGERLLKRKTEDAVLTRSLTRSQDTLMDKKIQKDNSVAYHIKVISWVIFYGHRLLLGHLLELITNNDKPCKVFGKTISEQTRFLTLGCCSGDLDTLEMVLKNVKHDCLNATLLVTKADIETRNKNKHRCKTPLTAACLHVGVAPRCVSKLIEMGSDVHKTDAARHVPIYNAAFSGNRDVLKTLLDAKADINYGNKGNSSPLFTTVSLNHFDAVRILIEFGASVNKGKSDKTTPLFRAMERGNLEIARYLIEKGAAVNLCDNFKRSPFHGVSIQGFYNNDDKILQEVVELLMNNNAKINATDKYNRTPLFMASKRGHDNIANVLLQHKADPNISDSFRRSPLFVAAHNKHTNTVDILLRSGAHKNITPKWTYVLRRNCLVFISFICVFVIVISCLLVYIFLK